MRCQPFVLTKGAMAPPDDRRSRSASNRMEAARAKLPELFLLLPRFHIPVPHVPHMGMVRHHASIQNNDLSIDVPRFVCRQKRHERRCIFRSSQFTHGHMTRNHIEQRSGDAPRSEEHTSELQSLMHNSYAVFGLTTKK